MKHLARTVLKAALNATFVGALWGGSALAQTYPNKPIRWVVPSTPGDGSDITGRIIAERLSRELGQPVVIDNKPGAGGVLGTEAAARSAPDGYTMIVGNAGSHGVNAGIYTKLPYDVVKDFVPVAMICTTPNVMVVSPSVKARNVAEFVALAKANPGKFNYASGGVGSSAHLSAELFKSLTGTTMQHVPYKGRQFAIPDLVGGQIQLMFDNMPSALPMAKEGKIRAVAQTTAKRSAAAPDVPTVAETVPGFEATTWFAVFAPAGTPKDVVARVNAEMQRVFKLPDVVDKMKTLGLEPWISTPEELAKYQASEMVKWAKVVKDSGAKAE
jgi:tripartite-type tricarboxylate transporter receptor subunit TctC